MSAFKIVSRVLLFSISTVTLLSSCVSSRLISTAVERPAKVKYKISRISRLPDELSETSGLEIWQDKILSFNDSGGEPIIYSFNMSGPVVSISAFPLASSINIDWEDIASDGEYLFIGDIGNNFGRRDTLKVYKIFSDSLFNQLDPVIQNIEYSYSEHPKKDNSSFNRSEFDAEAMAVINDSIYIFTKNWSDHNSSWLYVLPRSTGYYTLKRKQILYPGFMVCGADYDPGINTLYFCGYKRYVPYVLVLPDYKGVGSFPESMTRIKISKLFGVQTEGIVSDRKGSIYISAEKSRQRQSLYKLQIKN